MVIQRAYKTKLRPTAEQRRYFGECCGAARFVFNWALADRKAMFEAGGKPNKFEQKRRFNATKDELCPWIRDYPYSLMQEEFDHVDAAYQNFFRRIKQGKVGKEAGFPKFKKRGGKASFVLRGNIHIEHGRVKLPRIGWVNLAENGYIPTDTKINFVTISERGSNWYISVQVEEETPDLLPVNDAVIGVDVGVKSIAVLSNGRVFDNPRILTKHEKKLARLQRELSRRNKGGSNWRKTKDKINNLHQKIADTRQHTQHNVSRAVVDSAGVIVLEDLNIKGMLAKAKPKQDENGRYLRSGRAAKRGLSRALSDAGISELHRQIEYKAQWAGGEVVKVNRFYPSSKTCSNCGYIHKDLTLADRTFVCPDCGHVIDRDSNAAVNLAAYGERLKRPGLPLELIGLPITEKGEGSE